MEEKEMESAKWGELPHECLISILLRLTLEERWCGAMRVCKAWHEACKDPYLNRVLDMESHFDPENIQVPRFWTPEFQRRVDNIIRTVVVWSSGGLTHIFVRHCSDRSLALVAKRCPNLQVLFIKNSHITDAIKAEIISSCPKLGEFRINNFFEITSLRPEFHFRRQVYGTDPR